METKRIQSLFDLKQLKKQHQRDLEKWRSRVLICMTGCRALGAQLVSEKFKKEIEKLSLEKQVKIIETGCIGLCARAPLVKIEPHDFLYGEVKPKDVNEIISRTIQGGKPVERLVVKQDKKPLPISKDINFYKKQQKLVLENCGQVDPQKIEDAITRGGYISAIAAITEKEPQEIIEEIKKSNLRGRGGAGFPTGMKWNLGRKSPGKSKYLICNADEGDPGAFMDRALLEGDPHRVIEGMLIAAYAIGSNLGFIYVRAEYPIAVEHINMAIEQARNLGLLGQNIAGSGFDFDIDVRIGAGAFVCGEETALIASLEGKRGMPNPRPPYPTERGFKGKPTVINNVETLANVPVILKNGSKWYQTIGTDKSKGTKIFALAGKVNNTGLVEVPMGTTISEIVYDIGNGIPDNKTFKAVQLGGPSGGCIPSQYLNTRIDFDSVTQIGAIMGSGGLIVMDEDTCMVDVARYFLDFCQAESCGKCTPCREGTKQMLDILETICAGNASKTDLETLEYLSHYVKKTSLCGLGQTAPNPALSTIKYFREEYEEHIKEKKCRAGVCQALLNYQIIDTCTGCGVCKMVCPADAIEGEKKQLHVINPDRCTKCGLCFESCKFDAIIK